MEALMNNSKHHLQRKNVIKAVVFSIVLFLFLFITLTFSALLLGFLAGASLKIILITVLFLEVLAFMTLLVVLIKLFKSIDTVNSQAELLAKGELNISDISKEDSFGLEMLAVAFNDMKYKLLRFIALTKVNIITIADAIDNVSSSMDRSYIGNEQIAVSMGNVAEKAEEQAKSMGDTMSKIYEVNTRIENIAQSVEKVEQSVEDSVQATASGVKNLDEYYQQVNVISDNLNTTSEYIKKLNADINQIGVIGKFITKTSEQLKLLGLNASVEAVKAGESGKGFTVVAHEMNLLSKATKESVGKISSILQSIQDRSEYVGNSIDNCVDSYDISKNIFTSIKQSFDIIENSTIVLEKDIKKVHNEVHLINSSTHEINQMSQQLYNASEDISNKTRGVSSVTQDELNELQKISISTSALKIMLMGVENLVEKFNTSVVPVEMNSEKQLRIVFISPLDNEFWYVIRNGVLYAKKELSKKNVIIDYYGIEQDVGNKIREAFINAIKSDASGIIVPGFDPELANLIEAAHEKSIPVMLFCADLPVKSKRVAFFGPNDSLSGAMAARTIARALNGKGEVAVFEGEQDTFGRDSTLAELKKYKGIKLVAHEQCADNIDLSYTLTKEILSKNGNIRAMLVLGMGIYGAAKAIEELGQTGKTLVISCFFNKDIAHYIKKGIVYAAISHDPFGQGHDPIIQMYNMLVTKKSLESDFMSSRIEIMDNNNSYELL